ncbi:MAG: cytochrome c3 family protein [Nitrospinae bacterium]|nr:cytochrome c3 family protein [Nitrospinota bacterium]
MIGIFLVTSLLLGLDLLTGTRFFATEGPLSSSHAIMTNKCNSCHTSKWTKSGLAIQERCVKCHADVKMMKFHVSTHQRIKDSRKREIIEKYCTDCHKEHRGRESKPSRVDDNICRNCHDIFNIEDDHPEFKPVKLETQKLEDIGLRFSHLSHRKNEKNSEEINKKFERGCLLCHKLDPSGNYYKFKKTSFETDCKDCHPLQELSIKKMFDGEDIEKFAGSIGAIMGKFGLESDGNFLSRFAYVPGNERRRRPEGFTYKPSHKDPYLASLFRNKNVPDEEALNALSQGKKGTTLNCLKCHLTESAEKARLETLKLGQNVSFSPVLSLAAVETVITKFSHKAHARDCADCHKKISTSEALSDININIDRKFCFSCHNNTAVKAECPRCHNFHKAMNQLAVSELMRARQEAAANPEKGDAPGK